MDIIGRCIATIDDEVGMDITYLRITNPRSL